MSIGSDDIEKLAVLARLSFEGDELGDITDKLASIVALSSARCDSEYPRAGRTRRKSG